MVSKKPNLVNPIVNVRERIAKTRSFFDQLADWIARWCGSWSFFMLHVAWFVWWILERRDINTLTLIVSLEAILLMAILLMAQNRQAERDDIRDEADYKADVHADRQVVEVRKMLKDIQVDIAELKARSKKK